METYLAALAPEVRGMIDELRSIVAGSAPGLVESIKWNAPSFASDGEDRITLGVERKGGVRLVLHRGARPAAAADFSFEDPGKIARWPSADRGVATFASLAAIRARRTDIQDLCARWIAQVA